MQAHPVPLSPSRVSDFKSCPQLFKFRVVDRLPETKDAWSARGILVHAVLERLFALAAAERTLPQAKELLGRVWQDLKTGEELAGLSFTPEEEDTWLSDANRLISNYFRLEDPSRVEARELEWWVEHEAERMHLRGIIDRLEVLPGGEWALIDYKTGRSPSYSHILESFFGLRFYALVCWRALGEIPRELRLMHLSEPEVLRLRPTARMLEGLERQLEAVAQAIRRAHATGDWRPRPSPFCAYCPHRAICPAWQEREISE
ncbi:MAG: RecB family exonuclease, partial [Actinomycetota bacterium]